MMTLKLRITGACLAGSLLLTGCAQDGSINRAGLGAALGGAIGAGAAAAGRAKPGVAILAGLGGAAVGGLVGHMLDERERLAAAKAAQQVAHAPTGTRAPWQLQAAHSRSSGWVTALDTPYKDAKGRECRKVRIEATNASGTGAQDHVACNQQWAAAAAPTSSNRSGWVIE